MHYGVVAFLAKTANGENWRRTHASREDALKKAQNVIGFTGGNIDNMIFLADQADVFLCSWRQAGRKTCDVRVRKDLMFGTRDDAELSEREFRVLAGIFSAVGAKHYIKIGWQSIQCRAAGWLTTPPAPAPNMPCQPLYPRGQIERTIAELVARNLVACVTYRRGERYWSHSLTRDQLWQAVQAKKVKRAQVRAERAARDAQASLTIKQVLGPS
jgi:hypothetical protein